MPLTPARLEQLNGHLPVVEHVEAIGYSAKCVCDCGSGPMHIWVGWYSSERRALESIRAKTLAEHGQIVMERAGWKCQNCGRSGCGLSAHHKQFRSHGRSDTVQNLMALCPACHEQSHQGRRVRPADFLGDRLT